MSRDLIEQLRESVAEAEEARDEADRTVKALEERLSHLPGAGAQSEAIERVFRIRAIRHCVIIGVLAAVALVLYHRGLKPSTDFTNAAEERLQGEVESLNGKAEELAGPETQQSLRLSLQIHAEASYPNALGESGGRQPYPALSDTGKEKLAIDAASDDVVWRWVNIGMAACTIGNKRWSGRAVDALHWLSSPKDRLGLPTDDVMSVASRPGDPTDGEAMAALLAHCFMAGQLNLRGQPPGGPDG